MDFISWPELKSIIGILFIIFLLGLCDDLVHIKPVVKLTGQAIAGSLVFFLLDDKLSSTYGLLGEIQFPFLWSYFITLFSIIIITNSFNLIDGIDGLAGTFSVVALTCFGIWFYMVNDVNYAVLTFALIGAVIGFLIFNWEPSKIFMGDTGALLIGMMLSLLMIHFVNTNESLPDSFEFKFNSPISAVISILIIPIVDTIRIIIIRLYRGVSPLLADKRHIHHCLVRLGLSHKKTVILLTAIHLIYLLIILAFDKFGEIYLLPGIILLSVILCLTLDRFMVRMVN